MRTSPLHVPFVCVLVALTASAQQPTGQRSNPPGGPDVVPGPATLVPGNDLCLGMTWEPTIAVDPGSPRVVAVAQGSTVQVSFNGGQTFTQTLNANVPGATPSDPGWCAGGDPSLAFDGQGRLFLTYLGTRCSQMQQCSPPPGSGIPPCGGVGRDVFLTGWVRSGNAFFPFVGPQNVTALAGHGAPHNADKEWLAADWFAGSTSFADRLYVVWSDIDQEPWEIWTTFSTDQGLTWSAAQRLSIAAEGRRVWPPHVTVAPNHDVYVAYHAQKGFLDGAPDYDVPDGVSGRVIVHRSTNGGTSYTKTATNPFDADDATFGEADMTWNVQHKPNGVIAGASYWLVGSVQPWVLADPQQPGRIYVVCCDDPDDDVDTGDAANVVLARSNDSGATWSAPIRVDDVPGNGFSVLPTAAIDPVGGAIVVTWYDARSGAVGASGDLLLDLRARASLDGGNTWLPSVDVNDGTFDPGLSTSCRFCCTAGSCPAGSPQTLRIGEYNGVAFGECAAHMVWADDASCGAGFSDIFYDRDPELGGDVTPPTIVCPPNVSVGCNDSTQPSATGFATAVHRCDANPRVGYVDQILPGNCPPSTVLSTIQRIWSASDQAGNVASCVQLISRTDFDPPVIHAPPPLVVMGDTDGVLLASSAVVQSWVAQASAADACTSATLSYSLPAFFVGDCGGTTTQVVFQAQDLCGNSDFAVSSVTVFVAPGSGASFCSGDGSATACPCANAGHTGHGCDIAQQTGGVCLTAQAFAPNGAGGGTVDLLGTNFPPGSMPLLLAVRSPNFENGLLGHVLGDGLLCIGQPQQRLGFAQAQNGHGQVHSVHTAGPGQFHYQLWFRNLPASFCDPAASFNLSNALTLTW